MHRPPPQGHSPPALGNGHRVNSSLFTPRDKGSVIVLVCLFVCLFVCFHSFSCREGWTPRAGIRVVFWRKSFSFLLTRNNPTAMPIYSAWTHVLLYMRVMEWPSSDRYHGLVLYILFLSFFLSLSLSFFLFFSLSPVAGRLVCYWHFKKFTKPKQKELLGNLLGYKSV